jgi:hypothetical protein
MNPDLNYNSRSSTVVGFTNVTNRLEDEVSRAKKYLASSEIAYLDPKTPLIKLLLGLDYSHIESELIRNMTISKSIAAVSRNLGFITYYSKPEVTNSDTIYPDGTYEFYVLKDDTDINMSEIKLTWRQQNPVKVISHNYTSLDMAFFKENNYTLQMRYAFIEIDVKLLAVMFNYWRIENREEDEVLTVQQFITQFVLSNLIESHIQHALINRYINLYLGEPVDTSDNGMQYYVSRHDDAIDKWLLKQLSYIADRAINYDTIINSLDLIFDTKGLKYLKYDESLVTKYNQWYYMFARLRYFEFLLTLDFRNGSSINRIDNQKCKREIERFLRTKETKTAVGEYLSDHLEFKFKLLLDEFL